MQTRVFRVLSRTAESQISPGLQGLSFPILDCPDWVNVIALTVDGDVVLIRQHRHGLNELTPLKFPVEWWIRAKTSLKQQCEN